MFATIIPEFLLRAEFENRPIIAKKLLAVIMNKNKIIFCFTIGIYYNSSLVIENEWDQRKEFV